MVWPTRTLHAAAAMLFLAATVHSAGAQVPLNGTQWAPIPETMHDLIDKGYRLSAVDGQSLSNGAVNTTFYLSGKKDLVRCGEAFGFAGRQATIFPCERLTAPRQVP
jgi:hypothetical protein